MMMKFCLLSISAAFAEEDHVSLLQTAAVKKHNEGDVFRAACENPNHGTFRACTLGRAGTCYGKVKMGYGNRWTAWKESNGAFTCGQGFGPDPAYGQAKECVCDGSANPPPDTSFRVACENPNHPTFRDCSAGRDGVCYGKVKMGYGNRWTAWKQVNGQFTCGVGFGPDPAYGQAKECRCEGSQEPPEGPYEHRVACENPGHGTFRDCTQPRGATCYGKVKMGFGNRWTAWKDVNGPFTCGVGFGPDPAYGQAKECVCMGTDSPGCPAEFRVGCENPGHGTFRDCTMGRAATCYGEVKMGFGNRWSAWRPVSGAFTCGVGFGPDPAYGQAKECICKGCDKATTTTTTAAPTTTTQKPTKAPKPVQTTTVPDKVTCDLCAVSGGTYNADGHKNCGKWASYPAGSSKCVKFQKKKATSKKCCGNTVTKPPKTKCQICSAGIFNPDGLNGNCARHTKAQGAACTAKQQDERLQARCCN